LVMGSLQPKAGRGGERRGGSRRNSGSTGMVLSDAYLGPFKEFWGGDQERKDQHLKSKKVKGEKSVKGPEALVFERSAR